MDNRRISFLPILALIVIVAALRFTVDPSLFLEPPWLLPITNTLFVTVVCLLVAYIALRNYKATGRIQILLLGCGLLSFGIGGAVAGLLRGVPGTGANLNVTIYNTAALISASFHFVAALLLLMGISPEAGAKRKEFWSLGSYSGIAIFLALFTAAAWEGFIPAFFLQGVGPTILRQSVLGTADILFVFSFLIFLGLHVRNREIFLYWYSCALALTAISLTAFFVESAVGSAVGWAGRFAQYLGGIYFLIAIVTAIRSAQDRRTSFDNILVSSLSPTEETFRALAEHSPDLIDRFDRELKHIYVNAAGLRSYGKSAASIIGKKIDETGIPEPYCSLWKARIQKVFETGQPMEVESYLPAGHDMGFYQSRCVPEYGVDGAVAHVLVVSRDLTERKRVEEALRASEGRLKAVIENLAEGLIVVDPRNAALQWNRAALQMHGYDNQEDELGFLTKLADIYELLSPEGKAIPLDEWPIPRLLRGEDFRDYEILVRHKKREWHRIFTYAGVLMRDERGRPLMGLLTIRDITERKRAEEALIRSEKLASVGRMAATVAHEINNPLAAVMNTLFIVRTSPDLPEPVRRYLDMADEELKRISHITRQALGFYRESSTPATVSVAGIMDSAVELLKTKIGGKQVKVEKQYDRRLQVNAVSGELRQVFSNLLANSLDAVPENGTIKLRISSFQRAQGRRCVRITVADNGRGIQPAARLRLFEPLFTTKNLVGTGLGLWVSKQIIDKHGGSIRVHSRTDGPHRGTMFSITLPAEAASAAAQARGASC